MGKKRIGFLLGSILPVRIQIVPLMEFMSNKESTNGKILNHNGKTKASAYTNAISECREVRKKFIPLLISDKIFFQR